MRSIHYQEAVAAVVAVVANHLFAHTKVADILRRSNRPAAAAAAQSSSHKSGQPALLAPNAPEHKTPISPHFIIKHNPIALMTHMRHRKEGAKRCDSVTRRRATAGLTAALATTNHSQVWLPTILRRCCVRYCRNAIASDEILYEGNITEDAKRSRQI